ncbi:tyrosine-protein phosphatase 10D-like [Glandiceps talaboti]
MVCLSLALIIFMSGVNSQVDECANNPCTSPFVCQSEANGYSCVCPPGITVNLEITVESYTEEGIRLHWTRPCGDFTNYHVTLVPEEGLPSSPVIITKELQAFTDLTPGKEYVITVQTAIGGVLTNDGLDAITQRTKPAAPGPIIINDVDITANEIHMSWSHSVGVVDLYEITYSPENGNINSPTSVTNTETSFTLTGLTPATEYTMEIRALAGQDSSVERQIQKFTKPPSPTLSITSYDTTTVQLLWLRPSGVSIAKYVVTITPQRDDGTREFDIDQIQTSYTLTQLTPGREYTIGIKAVVTVGSTLVDSAPDTAIQRLVPTPPQSVNVPPNTISDTSVVVTWSPSTGDVTEYRITYTPTTTQQQPVLALPQETAKLISGLTSGQTYTFTIIAVSGNLQSIPVTGSAVTTLPNQPGRITVDDVTRSTIIMTWEAAQESGVTYEVGYQSSDDDSAEEVTFTTTSTTYMLTGLDSFVTYTLTVRTIIGSQRSELSQYQQRTFGDLPSSVRDFSIKLDAPRKIYASFLKPLRPNGIIDTYIITFTGTRWGSPQDGPTRVEVIANTGQTSYTDESLGVFRPGYTYTFTIKARNGIGESAVGVISEPSAVTLPVTAPQAQALTSRDLKHELYVRATHWTITISLSDRLFDDQHGVITSYAIFVAQADALPREVGAFVPNYNSVKASYPVSTYQTSEAVNYFEVVGGREKVSSVEYVIGDEECRDDRTAYCNGPLKALTRYVVKIRAYVSDNKYNDTVWSSPMSTRYDPWWFGYAVIGIVALGIIVVCLIVICRCCHEDKFKQNVYKNYAAGQVIGLNNPVHVRNDTIEYVRDDSNRYVSNVMDTHIQSDTDTLVRNGTDTYVQNDADTLIQNGSDRYIRNDANILIRNDADTLVQNDADTVIRNDANILIRNDNTNTLIRNVDIHPNYTLQETRRVIPAEAVTSLSSQPIIIQQNTPHVQTVRTVKTTNNVLHQPKVTALARPVRITNFAEHYAQMAADSGYKFQEEYDDLRPIGTNFSTRTAELAENRPKNRYTNILPYEHTRVKLEELDDALGSDYINANYLAGYNSPREYIATQGPLPNTGEDFWRMVWEQNVPTIVMVTELVERGRIKCDHYWPYDSEPTEYGNITVTMTSESILPEWIVHDLTLEQNHEVRAVRHFQFTSWPDHGVPESADALLRFVRTVRGQIPRNGGPTVTHCSAGVGRSGTYICLDFLLQQLARKENEFVDIFRLVANLRQKRCFMVQTEAQYVFIHKAVLDVLQGNVSDSNWLLTPSSSQTAKETE